MAIRNYGNKPVNQESLMKKYTQGTQSQATGNRVYNGFAPSPHAGGGLAKSGYQQRDQTARLKQQGQRSGSNKSSFLMGKLRAGGF